ncbi:MAG: RNA pseudouridine synthase [Bacteroidetes bacterium]|nr:RNA pseudouridine synthase [Bacteroidota bacterium]
MKGNSTDISKRILLEDNHLIIINKLPGEIIQEDKTGDIPLVEVVKDYIRKKYHKPGEAFLGVIHRIDRPVSGIVVFARTSKALIRMNEVMKKREIKKTYWAVVKNQPPETEADLVHYLKRNEKENKAVVFTKMVKDSLIAELHYRILAGSDNYYLLEIDLKTGRHHQIRAQLAAIGCPVKGDLKYGYPRSNENGSIHLHARRLNFIHPVRNEEIEVVAPLPDDVLWNYFNNII